MKQLIFILFLGFISCIEPAEPPMIVIKPKHYIKGYYYDSAAIIPPTMDVGLRSLTITDSTIQGHDYYIRRDPGMTYIVDSVSPVYSFKQLSDTDILIDGVKWSLNIFDKNYDSMTCTISIVNLSQRYRLKGKIH